LNESSNLTDKGRMADDQDGLAKQTPLATSGEPVGLFLGDTFVIIGGSLNKTRGKLYGISEDRFALLPSGATDRIIKISLVNGNPDPELGITDIKILKKSPSDSFIHLIDLRAGQEVETFFEGPQLGPIFKVISVNEENDSAVFEDESGTQTEIIFGFTGIPRELGYEVMRTREPPAQEEMPSESGKEGISQVHQLGPDEDDIDGGVKSPAEAAEADAAEAEADESAKPMFILGEEIEIEIDEEITEVGSAFRVYQDVFQRSEMLGELIRSLSQSQQRNPIKLQETRRLVELMILLRNDVVQYGVTGEPRGGKPTSRNTLAELVTGGDASLVRKVAQITKVLYLDKHHAATKIADGAVGPLEEGLYAEYLADVIKQAETLDKLAELGGEGEPTVGMPKFFLDMENYRQKIQTPYRMVNGRFAALTADEEVFRLEVPDEPGNLNVLAAYPAEKGDTGFIPNPPYIIQNPFALTRVLRNRSARFTVGEEYRVVEAGENPVYSNLLVFPRTALRTAGPIRSGSLARDVSLGMTLPETMEELLERLGEITDFPTADGILMLGVDGNILGNVLVKDWLENMKLLISGLDDTLLELRGYGGAQIEFNLEQVKVIQGKIEQHLAGLKIFMTKQREANKTALSNLRFEQQPLLEPAEATRLLARIESEPLLQKVLEKVRDYMGDLAEVDVNWFSYLVVAYPDLLLATLGQQPHILTKERLRHVRDQSNAALMTGYRIKRSLIQAGEVPTDNLCKHVAELDGVRKLGHRHAEEPRDITKMKGLLKLLNKFRGRVEENWVWCNVCDKHLICGHELLQVQEFLRPKEKDAIQKELILKFSGGQFGGKFICSVCGQGIQELDFDTNIEFDDAGRPMMGRAVMVDEDAIKEQRIEDLMSGPSVGEEEEENQKVEYASEELTVMYKSIKKLTGLVGINPEPEDYRKMVEELSNYISGLTTREAYAAATKGKKAQDYDIWYSIRYISAVAAIVLLNIQVHMPDYIIYYTNADCREGFFGYPLESEANLSGINCVTTVVAGINDNEFPWNLTTLQRQTNLLKRRDALLPFVRSQVEAFVKAPLVQANIKKKKEYRVRLYGTSDGIKKDQLSTIFRPVPYIVEKEEAAANPITEGASSEKKATAWIRMAHSTARDSSALNPDSPYSETTCCLHNVSITSAEHWASSTSSMPKLEPRVAPTVQRSVTGATTFHTEKPKVLEGKLDEKDYYKLFVRLCYQGQNKGLPHQLGVGLSCSQCELSFQENPSLNFIAEGNAAKDKQAKEAADLKLRSHIEAQGIIITDATFADLLRTARQKSAVADDILPSFPRLENTLEWLAQHPAPYEGWTEMLNATQLSLHELMSSSAPLTKIQIAQAAEELVKAVGEKEEFVRARLGTQAYGFIESMLKRSSRECGEAVSTYLLVPYKRWLSGMNVKSFKILDSYELSSGTKDDILNRGMGAHLQILGGDEELKGVALRKVRAFIDDLSSACRNVFSYLRPLLTPGGKDMEKYLLRAYLIGIIHKFIDPHQMPPLLEEGDGDGDGAADEDDSVPNMKLLYKSLGQTLTKYAVGSKVPTEEEIRIRLEQRVEQEKQVFIGKLDRMTRDERRVELVLKGLGMGDWAAGGSKAIRQYDEDRYEVERAERAAAGITDYNPQAQGEQGRPVDMFGLDFGADYDAGGGYDHDEMGEDDY
jgi:hypothetical protein